MKAIIITAANDPFFDLLKGLLSSIEDHKSTPNIKVGLLDVGLTEDQKKSVENLVDLIVVPDWDFDFPHQQEFPSWFKALTARPCLPKYFPDFDIYIWIDADAWIQEWSAIEMLIDAAQDGKIAIVEEQFGSGLSIESVNADNNIVLFKFTPENIQNNVTSCYELCYGEDIAKMYGKLPPINAGVWAMSRNSKNWDIWSQYLKYGLNRVNPVNYFLVEQNALNIGIRRGEISAQLLPRWCNWVCIHELPTFDPETLKLIVSPEDPQPIGILHMVDLKLFSWLTFPTSTDGVENLPLQYLEFRDWCSNWGIGNGNIAAM